MAVPSVTAFLSSESGRLSYDIYQRNLLTSPILTTTRKAPWWDGMGPDINVTQFNRAYLNGGRTRWAEETFHTIGAAGMGVDPCNPTADTAVMSTLDRAVQLRSKAIYSPYFCVEDLRMTGARERQMSAVVTALSELARQEWIEVTRDEQVRVGQVWFSGIKDGMTDLFVDGAGPQRVTGFTDAPGDGTLINAASLNAIYNGLPSPTAIANVSTEYPAGEPITWDCLDLLYDQLIMEGGTRHALSMQNGRPIFGLITDQLTMRNLIKSLQQNDGVREDFRDSSMSDKLLMAMGVSHTFNGWVFMCDDLPQRWCVDITGDTNIADYDFAKAMTNSGFLEPYDSTDPELPILPLYRGVTGTDEHVIQTSQVVTKNTWQLRVPSNIGNVGKAKFPSQNYMGDYSFLNVLNDDVSSGAYNPDGKYGRFRGVLTCAAEPIAVHSTYTIVHGLPTNLVYTAP